MDAVGVIADRYLGELARLNPILATRLGEQVDGLPDFSPDGAEALVDAGRAARHALADADRGAAGSVPEALGDARCRRLLLDRVDVAEAQHEAGEHLRPLRVIGSPVEAVRGAFDPMPRVTNDDWELIGGRLARVPAAYRSLQTALEAGMAAGLTAAPRQAAACAEQLAAWAGDTGRPSWFHGLVAGASGDWPQRLASAATAAGAAAGELGAWLRSSYVPACAETPDAVGAERYAVAARAMLGSRLDPNDAYAWAWEELHAIEVEMRRIVGEVKPGATLAEAMAHLDATDEFVVGEAALSGWLQDLMDRTVASLQGSHFDLAPEIRRVEAMIAPPGTAAAQYYSPPSADFRRPGRTWYPTLGRDHFPLWSEYSTCYHEGVPGHHMQLAHWVWMGSRLSRFQTTVVVSGNIEGWALYAERLMDELGAFDIPAKRLGYLVAQQLRATRVIIDIGMHLELTIPTGQAFHPGERWTAQLGRTFLGHHAMKDPAFLDSEWVRYLGWPAQAISYKLGERAWLAGRDAARRRAASEGRPLDAKAWHMAALSMGSCGLDDLAAELPGLVAT